MLDSNPSLQAHLIAILEAFQIALKGDQEAWGG